MIEDFVNDHGDLLETSVPLLDHLRNFRSKLRHGSTHYYQHDVFAERARSLSLYLSSALRSAREADYLSAFALLRPALEHQLTDRLLFLADRYKRQYTGVRVEEYQQLVDQRSAGDPGTEDIVDIRFSDGTMWVVRSGLHPEGERDNRTLSIYYFLLEEFDPFVGRASEQEHLAAEFTPLEIRMEIAEEQQRTYATWLTWRQIKDNLRENALCSDEDLRRLEVHYRFLSAYVHPVPAGYDLVYGGNRPSDAPRYDHYAAELVLLYINKITAAELEDLLRMSRRTPAVRIEEEDDLRTRIASANSAAAHLWFPGGDPPHSYDRVAEANTRGVREDGSLVPLDERLAPEALREDEISYYRNPLRRLVGMHQSFQEITGFSYQSPWPPRSDARFR